MKKIGNWIGIFVLVSFLLVGQAPTSARATGTIRYVAPGGIVSGSCNSWAHACYLQYALATVSVSGDQLWVEKGTYKPTTSNTRTFSFILRNGIRIYGGFAGTETKLSQRNPATHVTILSGDIGSLGDLTDNSYHVVNASGVTSSAVLDGFTVTGGNADGSGIDDAGGGILDNNHGSPTLSNLTLKGNSANYGGGMYNFGSSPTMTKMIFHGNSAANYGGGMYNDGSSNPKLTDVTFSGNSTFGSGGGIANFNGSRPKLTNVTFSGNSAFTGGGIFDSTSGPFLTDVTFHGNSAVLGGGIFDTLSTSTLTNVTFQGNSATTDGGGMYNTNSSSPVIHDSVFWSDGSEIFNSASTPTIVDSLVAGGCPLNATCNGALINANPLLGPLANNGGFTQTMALGAGSPAIDTGGINSTCASKDQRGVKRPQGPHCDMGAYEAPVTKTFRSIGAQDGSILESGENTNAGGTLNNNGSNLILGDDAARKQYRSVLSFDTSTLPDDATISSIRFVLTPISVSPSGSNPVSLLQGFMLDVKKGFFGSSSALQVGDFQASANKTVGPFLPIRNPVNHSYTISVPNTTFASINKLATNGGLTQIRLRFKLDDNNNNIANFLSLFSGNNSTASIRPTLIVIYTTP